MMNIYERLRDRLETMATGYPATASGVELKILRQLFSEDEATLFLQMETSPETAHQVALRLGADAVARGRPSGRNGAQGAYLQSQDRMKPFATFRFLSLSASTNSS